MRSRCFLCVHGYGYAYAKIASVAGGLIFSPDAFFYTRTRTLSVYALCMRCSPSRKMPFQLCARWNCFMQLPISLTAKHLLNVWFYANVNTVNGQCVCEWVIRHTFCAALTNVSARFFTLIFVLLLHHLIILNAIYSLCLFIAFYAVVAGVFVGFLLFWCRFVYPMPIHSCAIVADSFFSAAASF